MGMGAQEVNLVMSGPRTPLGWRLEPNTTNLSVQTLEMRATYTSFHSPCKWFLCLSFLTIHFTIVCKMNTLFPNWHWKGKFLNGRFLLLLIFP